MRAMVLEAPRRPLVEVDLPDPSCGPGQVLLQVHVCGVCRTDLHLVDGDLPDARLPIVPGHQIVGAVTEVGDDVKHFAVGDRVGIPWLGGSCGHCRFCRSGRENLCDKALYTGCQVDGGFAEMCVADARFCFPVPAAFSDLDAAPLLCAGLIGYRSLRMAGNGRRLGFYGFGASAHILIQVARYQSREVYVFTRPDDRAAQDFARSLGAVWVGSSEEPPPVLLDAAIVFAPVGELVPLALKAVSKGGVVVCAGIHMSDIPSFPYSVIWGERVLRSVANLTRSDAEEFLLLAPKVPVRTQVTPYPLERANDALADLREGRVRGGAVIVVKPPAVPAS